MNKKELSERDICTKFITPALTAGNKWDLMNQIREEVSFTKGRVIVRGQLSTRGEAKRADYLLSYKPGIRNDEDLHRCCHYTLMNPVTARMCARPEDWKWSSAHVAQPSSVANWRTVPVRELGPHGPSDPHSGGGTPPEPAGGDACAAPPLP